MFPPISHRGERDGAPCARAGALRKYAPDAAPSADLAAGTKTKAARKDIRSCVESYGKRCALPTPSNTAVRHADRPKASTKAGWPSKNTKKDVTHKATSCTYKNHFVLFRFENPQQITLKIPFVSNTIPFFK